MKSLDKKIIQKETFNDNITEKIVVKETKRKKTPSGEAVGRPEYKEDEKVLVVAKNVSLCFWRNLLDLPYMGNVLVDEGNREDFVKVLQIICNNFVLVRQFAKNRSRAI